VAKEFHPDPSDASGKFGMVGISAVKPFKTPVTLADIKADDRFEDLALVRQSRLSVVPISDEHWAALCEMGGVKP
jgi:predicted RNA-binding protein with PUA-like domain